jgi:hypothetical protein
MTNRAETSASNVHNPLARKVELLQRELDTLHNFMANRFDPMDTALSWCRVDTFRWVPGSEYANTSWSLGDIVTGPAMGLPAVRFWLRALRKEDRKRFFVDLRLRLSVTERPVDGCYEFKTSVSGWRRFFLRTVLAKRRELYLVGTVIDVSGVSRGSARLKMP